MKMRLIVCLILGGSCRAVHAEDPILKPYHYGQEVRSSLRELQSYLYKMAAYECLTPEQYKIESQRVRQLDLQWGADTPGEGAMTVKERNTDFAVMDQIQREASQWAAAKIANGPYCASTFYLSARSSKQKGIDPPATDDC